MFYYSKKDPQIWLSFFYYEIDTVYIYSWKKLIKFWPILVMHLTKSIFFLAARGVQFNNGVTPPPKVIGPWQRNANSIFFHPFFLLPPNDIVMKRKKGREKEVKTWKNEKISKFLFLDMIFF